MLKLSLVKDKSPFYHVAREIIQLREYLCEQVSNRDSKSAKTNYSRLNSNFES